MSQSLPRQTGEMSEISILIPRGTAAMFFVALGKDLPA